MVEGAVHLLDVEEPLEEQGSEPSKFSSTYSEGGVGVMGQWLSTLDNESRLVD